LAGRAAQIEANTPNVERLMQAADIFAFPSTQEGLGTAVIEALSCGLPVVASRLPGVTDWMVKHGENGFLVAIDREQLSRGIEAASLLLPARPQIATAAAGIYRDTVMDDGYRALLARVAGRRARQANPS
jgi:glycosyltransferase involved in cell wall biosynthesis